MDKKTYNSSIDTEQLEKQVQDAVISAAKDKFRTSRRFRILCFIAAAAVLVFLLIRGGFELPAEDQSPERTAGGVVSVDDGKVQVHFIDVGQGDCELIVSDDGSTMLIDCGERAYSADVLNYIDNLGITRLDYVLCTHPHTDHMGGMADIINSDIEIGTFIMPQIDEEYTPTNSRYEKMIIALSEKDCLVKYTETEVFSLGGGTVEIITVGYGGESYNNYSPILRFTYGKRAFLFTGDAEDDIEEAVLAFEYDVSADVYKAGHHGSSTSSSPQFVAAVNPSCFVISCGAGNSYGHPHSETIALAGEYTDIILRTDINGDIVFITDGEKLEYLSEKE